MHLAAGINRHARTAANRGLDVGPITADSVSSQPVNVGRMQMRMPVTAEVIPAQLIEHDKQDVFGFGQTRALPQDASGVYLAITITTAKRNLRLSLTLHLFKHLFGTFALQLISQGRIRVDILLADHAFVRARDCVQTTTAAFDRLAHQHDTQRHANHDDQKQKKSYDKGAHPGSYLSVGA